MAPPPLQEEGAVSLPRVTLDLKIPMWGLVTAAGIGLAGIVGMYYQLDQVSKDMVELKIAMKANNATTIQFAQEQALLRFRIEKLEQDQHKGDRR